MSKKIYRFANNKLEEVNNLAEVTSVGFTPSGINNLVWELNYNTIEKIEEIVKWGQKISPLFDINISRYFDGEFSVVSDFTTKPEIKGEAYTLQEALEKYIQDWEVKYGSKEER